MPTPLTADTIVTAPKVLLHDHLDGGLRPATLVGGGTPTIGEKRRDTPGDASQSGRVGGLGEPR